MRLKRKFDVTIGVLISQFCEKRSSFPPREADDLVALGANFLLTLESDLRVRDRA